MKIIHFDTIDSTNLYLKNNYKILENLTFVDADYQTRGKGRYERVWESKKGENLLFSLLILDKKLLRKGSMLSLFSAITVLKFLINKGLKDVKFKWPNDVYVNGKKICGILLEGISESDKLKAIVIGVGLNVNQVKFSDYYITATSIKNETSKKIDINLFKKELYDFFISELENFNRFKIIKLCNEYNCLYNHTQEIIDCNKKSLQVFKNINLKGEIVVMLNKKKTYMKSGEIIFKK